MKDGEYIKAQGAIMTIARLALLVDVEGFLERIAHAEAVGPVIDPTLYRKAIDNLSSLKELAKAVKGVQEAAAQLVDGALKRP